MKSGFSVAVLLLALLAAINLIEAICPNNCSPPNGRCVSGNCTCNIGWGSPDCSVQVQGIIPGQTLAGQFVPQRQWKYYSTTARQGGGGREFTWAVNTTTPGDIDIFVQKDRLPTRTDYIARNITTAPNFHVSVPLDPNEQGAIYYVGIFAFSGSTDVGYNIHLRRHSECYNGCSGHGTCDDKGECHCQPGWVGRGCGERVETLQINKAVSSSVKASSWQYFHIHAVVENTLRVIVNQTCRNGDIDLYVKFKSIPTLISYDLVEQGLTTNFYLDIQLTTATFGDWYLGIFGVTACTFQIQYTQYNDCPNSCSSHGTCSTNGCRCNPGFSGAYCETKTEPLDDGQRVGGFVGDNTWNWYTHTSHSTTDMLITVTETGNLQGQDCDIYVRRRLKPTLANYDYRNITLAHEMTVRIPQPQFVEWHIGVFGFSACSYMIVVTSTDKCGSCVHGTCDSQEGSCICNAGWAGDNCDIQIQQITNYSQPIQSTLSRGGWQYYSVQGIQGRLLVVEMKELRTRGYFWLFLHAKSPPTLTNYNRNLVDKESNTNWHRLHVDFVNNDIWYIGVYGDPFSIDDRVAYPYELQAWESPI